nr:Rz1 family lipoprotein [Pantoea septica]
MRYVLLCLCLVALVAGLLASHYHDKAKEWHSLAQQAQQLAKQQDAVISEQMLRQLSIGCSVMLLLANVGYSSRPAAQPCRQISVPPPAWLMKPASDLMTPLNGITSLSEVESNSRVSK